MSAKRTQKSSDGRWMQKAQKRMEAKGTVGSFTRYCGGKVTEECIQRGLRSPSKKIRAKARFARTARRIAARRKRG